MTDVSSDHESAWRAFQAAQTLRLQHETLEWEWTRGRTDFVAFLIAITDEEVRRHLATQVDRIGSVPGVEPYPERYWHITVKGVGFLTELAEREDEVSIEDVKALAEEARPLIEATDAFEVQIGLANAFPEVVYIEALEGGAVRSLNTRLLSEIPSLIASPWDGDKFLPHISIARFTSVEGLAELKNTLRELRTQAAGPTFTVSEVLLIQAHLSTEAPTFELLASYPLRTN